MDAQEDGDAVVAVRHVGGHALLHRGEQNKNNCDPRKISSRELRSPDQDISMELLDERTEIPLG